MMKPIWLARIFFILIATYCVYRIGLLRKSMHTLEYSLAAFTASIFVVIFEYSMNIISSKKILFAAAGCFFGLTFAWLIAPTIPSNLISPLEARIICNLLLGYFGIILALKHADRFTLKNLKFIIASPNESSIILDTNILIDGRVIDIVLTDFLKGNLIVPEFVLDELQLIADSTDPKKRARGRRGLENLEKLKEVAGQQLQILNREYPEIPDVDHRLIKLASELNCDILTNDFNLAKVASLHQINVLNLNDLVQALKPPVFVGEPLRIKILREGKEHQQGVGYLDDGTMVVVDDARRDINNEIYVSVTSLIQTSAGRMIFARKMSPYEIPKDYEEGNPQPSKNGIESIDYDSADEKKKQPQQNFQQKKKR